MGPQIASVVYAIGICVLFWLDRDREARTSIALWIPVLWVLINGSRPISSWFQTGPTTFSAKQYLDGSPVDAAVWGTLLAAGLIVLAGRSRQVGMLLRTNVPVLLFFAYCALSIFWSEYPFVAFKRWTKAVGDLVMVLIVLTETDRYSAIKRLLGRAGFVLIPLSVLFIKYYPDLGRTYNVWTWEPMYSGVTLGKNLLGMACLIFGVGSVWRFVGAYCGEKGVQRTRQLIAHGVVIAMAVWLLFTANSMTSLSCFVMATGLIVMTSLPAVVRRPAAVHLLVAAPVALSLFALFFSSGSNLVESLGRNPTLTGRTAIWTVVLSLAGNPLVGTGFESFWLGDRLQKVWELTATGIQEAHNGYLEVYLNLGWVGVTLLGVLIVTGYRNILTVFRRDPNAGRIRLAFFVVGLIYSLTEAGFRMMALVWIFFLWATTAIPEPAVPENLPQFDTDHGQNFPQRESQFDYALSVEFGDQTS